MRERFWELPLKSLKPDEWEALCDGCGKCCLNKIEYEDTGELAFTRVACKLLDGETCQCSNYANRHKYVPDCVVLTPKKLKEIAWWLPATCAYRLRAEGKPLFPWHYLISGDRESIHQAGISIRGRTVSELTVTEDDWDDYIIEDLA
ncbi:MAG TPA: YcgN family cysteine cluster protein [Paracoccus sp. (in: a-proteobacteria)]|uniref:YcgN family cysteine cluster protein n=1 Tax=Paracoccus sp. TaxID=267 RepID=UPI002CEAE690|nr:YcgN family cysteine cluster protein [Paracoccus sp. (in: a-proteobacteria)]HWL55723.1 YcgN family cysteine cluster protein [Paracoccus sp. (in: a-proteobacteria)]